MTEILQKGVLTALKGIFKNILTDFVWTDNIKLNRDKLIEEFNKVCNCFIEGELIFDFRNECNSKNNTVNSIQDGLSIMDTYINFENNGTTHVINSIVKTNIEFKIVENLDSIKPDMFWNQIQFNNSTLDSSEKLKFLESKKQEVRLRKMFNINKQQFEPAADWRDIERKIIEMIEKELGNKK